MLTSFSKNGYICITINLFLCFKVWQCSCFLCCQKVLYKWIGQVGRIILVSLFLIYILFVPIQWFSCFISSCNIKKKQVNVDENI